MALLRQSCCERMQQDFSTSGMGSSVAFAARTTSGRLEKQRLSLRDPRTGKLQTNLPFGLWHPNGAYGPLQTFCAAIYATFFVPSKGRLTMAQYF